MHYKIKNTRIDQLLSQRHRAYWVIGGLFFICLTEALTIDHLVNHERLYFTPLPQVITQPFSISKNDLSAGYLADLTRYFAMLRLNYTPATIRDQARWLLRYTDGAFYGRLKQQLAEEITQTKAHDISVSFAPVDTRVDVPDKTVWIDGDLTRYVGKTRLPTKRVHYQVTYHYQEGQLRVTSMCEITQDPKHA